MRSIEPDSLQAQLDATKHADNAEKWKHHQAEQWRDRLLQEPKDAAAFLDTFQTDAQRLSQLIRAAPKSTRP